MPSIGTVWTFDYIGTEQTLTIPVTGTYKLETWGAQGGSYDDMYTGGSGSYSIGNLKLIKRQTIYINIGEGGTYCKTEDFTNSCVVSIHLMKNQKIDSYNNNRSCYINCCSCSFPQIRQKVVDQSFFVLFITRMRFLMLFSHLHIFL